mmetsp:Transcript_25007/g.38146  ORF Transcript_25007/g.38146 Transcript_25007/m.38146 type:complete len:156 (-) Transcript_25007:1058-1525(-)
MVGLFVENSAFNDGFYDTLTDASSPFLATALGPDTDDTSLEASATLLAVVAAAAGTGTAVAAALVLANAESNTRVAEESMVCAPAVESAAAGDIVALSRGLASIGARGEGLGLGRGGALDADPMVQLGTEGVVVAHHCVLGQWPVLRNGRDNMVL